MGKRFFLDTEFIESGLEAPIDLISIGIVCEDGRELYLENSEARLELANEWVQTNVIPFLGPVEKRVTRTEIRQAVIEFLGESPEIWGLCCAYDFVIVSQLMGFGEWPKTWPFYFCDMAQEAFITKQKLPESTVHHALEDARMVEEAYSERVT